MVSAPAVGVEVHREVTTPKPAWRGIQFCAVEQEQFQCGDIERFADV